MAYNREWDQGKEAWAESSSWGGGMDRGTIRGREEEYYNDGKRRKHNNGGYDNNNSYEDYSHGKGNYSNQDFGDDRAQRGGGFKKRLTPSEPSPHVIFLGLDPDFTEADLQAYLTSNGCSIETVTIIRERSSGSSKGFGFAQFTSTEHARAFVDPLFPFIQVPPPASHGASATATFYKALETNLPHNGRRVKIDYSQSASPHDKGRARANANDGTRDIGSQQGPVLLFRGLDPLSGPQAIYQAMLYSKGPNKESPKGMRRIILIKDKVTMASFGFAFVEFVDSQCAAAVLGATLSPQIHPSGFRISDKPVAASFAHPYSFQPVSDFLSRDDACLKSSLSLGGVEDTWVRYWDETSTVAVLEFKVDEPTSATSTHKEKEKKKKHKTEHEALERQAPAAPSELPISDKPVTLSFNKAIVKPSTATGPVKTVTLALDDNPVTEEEQPPEAKVAPKVVVPLVGKKTASNISKWTQVQEELAQESAAPAASPLGAPQATSTPSAAGTISVSKSASPAPIETEFEFSDVTGLTCLLCARQFKSLDQLKRHNKDSDLHKKNYQDANLREIARQKAVAKKAGSATEAPKYRDRASERRILFNQPDVPVPEKDPSKASGAKNPRRAEGPPKPPTPPPPPLNLGEDQNNVGNKLLKLMGWKEGTGLGTEGDGRIDPIPTAIYAQGAGLGASKGKELGKLTDGYSGYVQMAQEAARERYGS
ncbi:hypothetical protein AX16_002938 [Volvariella volvacea WC 439]|nr:hypothetical protein AX16_002938 [Volvariella volvacea WC 439]